MGDVFVAEEAGRKIVTPDWGAVHTPRVDLEGDLLASTLKELREYHQMNQAFSSMEPDDVLVQISAITARLTYLRACLMDSGGQRAAKIRTSNLDPLMMNLELQFRIASRRLTSHQFDFEVTRGAPS